MCADPPPSAPVIEGYTDGAILPVGHSLTLTCSVHGGKPLVTAVHFSCPSHDDVTLDRTTQNVVISTLRIQLTSSSDGMVCSCSAQWKNSTYSLSSSRLLRVSATARECPRPEISPFTLHLGSVHPLQDVALHQCLSLSSVYCLSVLPSPRLCPSTAGCSPPSMPFIVFCLLPFCVTVT